MRISACMNSLLIGTLWLAALSCNAQADYRAHENMPFELAATFDAAHSNTVAGYDFWMEGGGAQAAVRITHHWSAVADLSVLHAGIMPHTTTGLDLTTVAFGPRYTVFTASQRLSFYGQALGGVAHGSNSFFPGGTGTASSASGTALLLGGGIDYRIRRHISARLLDCGWLRTSLSNGTTTVQNNLRLASGLVFRF